jgi:soluble lytic murein transglycosylase
MNIKQMVAAYMTPVSHYATAFGVEPSLIFAVIRQESQGEPNAKGSTGDFGLMQITQPALTDFNVAHNTTYKLEELFDADLNIKVGSWFLSHLYKQTADWRTAVRAYNAGLGRVQKSSTAGVDYANSVFIHQNAINNEMWRA